MVCSKEYYLTYNCHLTTAKKYYSKIGTLSPVIIYVNIMKGNKNAQLHLNRNKKAKPTGKRIGKSKPSKANNQLNRRVK